MELQRSQSKGSVIGGILLIAGCSIGAGMLGLPLLSSLGGFLPSVVLFTLSWVFMACTGLLLLEVNLWFNDEVNIISMTGRTLGKWGKMLGWTLFLFLFYCLMVAYGSGSGELVADFIQQLIGYEIPQWVGSFAIMGLFGLLVYLGTGVVDRFNRFLMAGLIITYLCLIALGLPYIDINLLNYQDWKASFLVLPVMIISFGFHNLIPSLTTYLGHDRKKLKVTVIIGSAIPLIVYLIWEGLILGLVPLEGEGGFREALEKGSMTTHLLKSALGHAWVVDVAHYFAFFAIVTSFLGVALSLVDFLADGLNIKKTPLGKAFLSFLAVLPPFLFAFIYPKIFLLALNYAGAFGAVILFGIMPALMVWSGRYRKNLHFQPLVPGGRFTLIVIVLFASAVFLLQLVQELQKLLL